MPRTRLGPRSQGLRQNWEEEDMLNAINAVRDKRRSLNEAARHFNVPKATLFRKIKKNIDPSVSVKARLGRRPTLPPELEAELVEYCLSMEKKFYGLTRNDIRRMAYQLASRNGLSNVFNKGIAGRAWFDHFINRHKDKLSVREQSELVSRVDKKSVATFFDLLEAEYETHRYPPDRIFNVDESGLGVVETDELTPLIDRKGKEEMSYLPPSEISERRSLVSVIVCASALGKFVPPMLIFPQTNWSDLLMEGAPPGALGRCHPSGWVQPHLFTEWFSHFLDHAKPTGESPVLLVLDGHFSHSRNLDVIVKAKENHVTILCLPPHTTRWLQPLDRAFMDPLKTCYSEEVGRAFGTGSMDTCDVAERFARAYLKVQTDDVAVSGFESTGIYPLNRGVFVEGDFVVVQNDVSCVGEEMEMEFVCIKEEVLVKEEFEVEDFGGEDFKEEDFEKEDFKVEDFKMEDFEKEDFEKEDFETNDSEEEEFEKDGLQREKIIKGEFGNGEVSIREIDLTEEMGKKEDIKEEIGIKEVIKEEIVIKEDIKEKIGIKEVIKEETIENEELIVNEEPIHVKIQEEEVQNANDSDRQCKICFLLFRNRQFVQLHMKYHESHPFRCETCNKCFELKASLQVHKNVHSVAVVACRKCDLTFPSKSDLRRHRIVHDKYYCKTCLRSLHNEIKFKIHMEIHGTLLTVKEKPPLLRTYSRAHRKIKKDT